MKRITTPVIIVTSIVMTCVSTFFITCYYDRLKYLPEFNPNQRGIIERFGNYKLISPLLGCEIVSKEHEVQEFTPIKNALQKVITQKINSKEITSASVYLRTLNSGRFLSIHGDEPYTPASLLKVALMMALYKTDDEHPHFLTTSLTYTTTQDLNVFENYKPTHPLIQNKKYTINELLISLIESSDNNAALILVEHLETNYPGTLSQVYDDLNIPIDAAAKTNDFLSTRAYSSLFRVLYNATYLSKKNSEAALTLLTNTEFNKGIKEGVPTTTTVAHKFGERALFDHNNNVILRELHDCGIIYYTDHPYFLCIMTKGQKFEELSQTISTIAQISYSSLDHYFTTINSSTLR